MVFSNLCSADSALSAQIQSIVNAGNKFTKGIYIINPDTNELVYSYNPDEPVKPASVMKLLITNYSLKKLGTDFRFETYIEAEGFTGTKVNNLIIRGQGDPSFTTESLWVLIRNLKKYGITEVGNIYLDDTAFVEQMPRSGQSAYQASNSALSFNFNTITFKVCGGGGSVARVTPDPWEYPIQFEGQIGLGGRSVAYGVDDYTPKGQSYPQIYRLAGSIPTNSGCTEVYRSVSDPVQYLAGAVQRNLNYIGITVTGKLYHQKFSGSTKKLGTHQSKALSQIIADLNKFSSNFIAEQLLYRAGSLNNRFSRKQGLINLTSYLKSKGFDPSTFELHDASGLSHSNRITIRILTEIFKESIQDYTILPEFLSSLAVSGQVGTLKKVKFSDGLVIRGKTGTINGVDSLIGMVSTKKRKKYIFGLIQNKVTSGASSRELENKIINLLYQQ